MGDYKNGLLCWSVGSPVTVFGVFVHFQTFHSWDWYDIRRGGYIHYITPQTRLTGGHSSLIDSLFSGHWLVEQFPCIWRQNADLIELKFGGQTMSATSVMTRPGPWMAELWLKWMLAAPRPLSATCWKVICCAPVGAVTVLLLPDSVWSGESSGNSCLP